jgi:hypothetical protein
MFYFGYQYPLGTTVTRHSTILGEVSAGQMQMLSVGTQQPSLALFRISLEDEPLVSCQLYGKYFQRRK